MSYSLKDLENAGKNLEDHFEKKAQKQANALADKIINGNLIGFLFARWFTFLSVYLILMSAGMIIGLKLEMFTALIAMVLSFLILKNTNLWYLYFKESIVLFVVSIFIASFLEKSF